MKIKQKEFMWSFVRFSLLFLLTLAIEKIFYCCAANELVDKSRLVNCTSHEASNGSKICPLNSICKEGNNPNTTAYYCHCLPNFELNPAYNNKISSISNKNNDSTFTNASITTNSKSNSSNNSFITDSPLYCLSVSNRIRFRPPANVGHLAFGILLVLFVVIAVVVLLYLVKISRPIKRSRAAYTRLKRRREQRQRLEEFNEDDICMIQLNENQKI